SQPERRCSVGHCGPSETAPSSAHRSRGEVRSPANVDPLQLPHACPDSLRAGRLRDPYSGRPDRRLSVPSSPNPGRGAFPRPFFRPLLQKNFSPSRGLHLGVLGLEPHHILRHFPKLLILRDSLDSFCSASS